MALMDLFSTKTQVNQVPTRSNQQMDTMNQLLSTIMPQLQQTQSFEPIAQAAQQRFNQQTMPSISERFAGMNAQRSSGYNQAMANAQRDLQTQLAGQQSQFQLGQQKNLGQLLGLGLQPQFENVIEEGGVTGLGRLLELLGHAGGAYLTDGASVPFSAGMLGAGTGGDYSQLMKFFGG